MKKSILLFIITIFSNNFLFSQDCIRITAVDPITNVITITNNTSSVVDISGYRMCSLFSYSSDISNGTTVLLGDPSALAPSNTIVIQWPINDNAADVAIYLPTGSFGDPSAMVDFMQYGSSGNGREGVADDAGLWTAGTFVENNGPMLWVGTCDDHSASNWLTTDLEEISEIDFTLSPNPVQDELTVSISAFQTGNVELLVYDLTGKTVLQEEAVLVNGQIKLSTASWTSGTYIFRLNFGNNNFALKKLIKE